MTKQLRFWLTMKGLMLRLEWDHLAQLIPWDFDYLWFSMNKKKLLFNLLDFYSIFQTFIQFFKTFIHLRFLLSCSWNIVLSHSRYRFLSVEHEEGEPTGSTLRKILRFWRTTVRFKSEAYGQSKLQRPTTINLDV